MNETKTNVNTDALYEIVWSRIYTKMLQFALELKLFDWINDTPRSLDEISAYCDMTRPSTRILLQYLCALKLLKFEGKRFSNTAISVKIAMNHALADELTDWAQHLELFDVKRFLRFPKKQPWYQIKTENRSIATVDGISEKFFVSEVRHQWRIEKGEELAGRYDFSGHKSLLDVGGASGGWCVGIQKVYPHLKCGVYDLSEVCRLSRSLTSEISGGVIEFHEGNFFTDALAGDADIVLLANVLHDWNKDDSQQILNKVYHYLPKGGVVLIYEYFVDDDWSGPFDALYHGITVLGEGEDAGWQPSYGEMVNLLQQSGFQSTRRESHLVIGLKN